MAIVITMEWSNLLRIQFTDHTLDLVLVLGLWYDDLGLSDININPFNRDRSWPFDPGVLYGCPSPLQGDVTYLIGPLHVTDRPSPVSEGTCLFLEALPHGYQTQLHQVTYRDV